MTTSVTVSGSLALRFYEARDWQELFTAALMTAARPPIRFDLPWRFERLINLDSLYTHHRLQFPLYGHQPLDYAGFHPFEAQQPWVILLRRMVGTGENGGEWRAI